FTYEDRIGPAIGDNMVQGQEQDMFLGLHTQQRGAHQWSPHQITGSLLLLSGQSSRLLLPLLRPHCLQIDDRQDEWADRLNDLHDLSLVLSKGGTQALVAADQGLDTEL